MTIPDLFRNCLTNPYLVQTSCQPPRWIPLGRIAVAGRGIEDMTRKQPKTEFVGIRMSLVDVSRCQRQLTTQNACELPLHTTGCLLGLKGWYGVVQQISRESLNVSVWGWPLAEPVVLPPALDFG